MPTAFENKVASYKTKSDDAADDLAAIYEDILTTIEPGVVKAKKAAETLGTSVRGIKELQQLLQIMDGGFVPIATEIITSARANDVEDPASPE